MLVGELAPNSNDLTSKASPPLICNPLAVYSYEAVRLLSTIVHMRCLDGQDNNSAIQ